MTIRFVSDLCNLEHEDLKLENSKYMKFFMLEIKTFWNQKKRSMTFCCLNLR